MDYRGKAVLITGGASGIGAAAARLFAAAGASVAIADRNGEAASALAQELPGAIACTVDVMNPDDCLAMVDAVRKAFGRLDCAFNNAGITEVAPLKGAPLPETHELPLDIWRQVLGVDLDGVFHCLRAELPLLLESGGGAIVNTTSLQAHISYPRTAAYTAAKHGVLGLTKTIAKEYGGRAIRCNAVSPGVVDTPLTNQVIHQPEYKDMLLAPIPIGRFAQPEDVAKAVVWLCSEDAAYINGAVLAADGGYLA
ncbi:SDR family oxidoreductase [Caenibius sp. WL]|uniref:SDR family NAD(P)-dependent oxidoreductase n=1 Tax=Caenibius sp. WL TaxID=2872646 RepID=UPI001C996141|nr:SDR family oxidoreductase [Caenibius sp. WL]QZP09223.1 SDR family oxidoreductase [Caenibius sp. WL]